MPTILTRTRPLLISFNPWIVFALLGLVVSTGASNPQQKVVSRLAEKEASDLTDRVKAAIVQVSASDGGRAATGTGVIISAKGHVVVGWPTAILRSARNGQVTIRLSNGREVNAGLVAESQEFRIALLKIEDAQQPFPFLQMGKATEGKTGDSILQLGYQRSVLQASSGTINRTVGDIWGTSTLKSWSLGGALVNRRGRLIGIVTHQCAPFFRDIKPNPNGKREAVHTRAPLIASKWQQWTSSKTDSGPPMLSATAPKLQSAKVGETKNREDAIATARKASIRIRRTGSDPNGGSSGVIVSSNGFIITCGHHFLLAGDKVTITFSDGREKPGHILGTNWVTDICIAKLDADGPWPFVPMAATEDVKAGQKCFTMGFATRGRRPDRSLEPREFTVADSKIVRTSKIRITSSGRRVPGESGGGVFSPTGHVLGIGEGWGQEEATDHLKVELFIRQWDFLVGQRKKATKASD